MSHIKIPPDINKRKDEYYNEKQKYLDVWRPIILNRDGYACRTCNKTTSLQLAHITPCLEFVKEYGSRGIKYSFREDNLVTLCSSCHDAHHKFIANEKIPEKVKAKGRCVGVLFNQIVEQRKWRYVCSRTKAEIPTTIKIEKIIEEKQKAPTRKDTKYYEKVKRLQLRKESHDAKMERFARWRKHKFQEQINHEKAKKTTLALQEIMRKRQ